MQDPVSCTKIPGAATPIQAQPAPVLPQLLWHTPCHRYHCRATAGVPLQLCCAPQAIFTLPSDQPSYASGQLHAQAPRPTSFFAAGIQQGCTRSCHDVPPVQDQAAASSRWLPSVHGHAHAQANSPAIFIRAGLQRGRPRSSATFCPSSSITMKNLPSWLVPEPLRAHTSSHGCSSLMTCSNAYYCSALRVHWPTSQQHAPQDAH